MKMIKHALRLKLCVILFFILGITIQHVEGNEFVINRANHTISTSKKGISYKWFYNGEELNDLYNQEIVLVVEGFYKVETRHKDGTYTIQEIYYSPAGDIPRIFVIGDSTASIYTENYFPRTGWGQVLNAFFNPDSATVIDMALSGRSSKSYYTDPDGWVKVLEQLGEGDYLFIQFGHNDEKNDDRHTDPYTTFQEYLSLYIDTARNRGAIPVLLTPINRNKWSGSLISDTHGDYPPAMRDLAAEKNVPLIDLHKKTKTLFESLGEEYTTYKLFMNLDAGIWVNYPTGNEDDTHLQLEGAYDICKLVTEDFELQGSIPVFQLLKNAKVNTGLVTAHSDPYLSGSITGNGIYRLNTEVTMAADAKTGYVFDGWYESDTLVSENSEYIFTLTDSTRNLTAKFLNAYEVKLQQSPSFKGLLSGSGYYLPGDKVTITASPKAGYEFVDWSEDDEFVTSDTSYTFIMGEADVTYLATFEQKTVSDISEKNINNLCIYPNPVDNNLYVDSENPVISIKLETIDGRILYFSGKNDLKIHINLDKLEGYSGLIIVQIETRGHIAYSTLIRK